VFKQIREKLIKAGRFQFSLWYAVLFAFVLIFYNFVIDVLFGDSYSFKTLFKNTNITSFLVFFIFWFLFSYFILWNQMIYEKKLKDEK